MFNVQSASKSHEIYISYNEYLSEHEDESIQTLEHILQDKNTSYSKGIIDLIAVKYLHSKDTMKIKTIYEILKGADIKELDVLSDNKKIIESVKKLIPDANFELLKLK